MDVSKFNALPRNADGMPIVGLLTDPDMSVEGEAFVSLVDAGANERTITVAKSWGERAGAWLAMLNPANWGRAAKQEGAPDFDAAIAVQDMRAGLWTATDTLVQVVHEILADDKITDKPAAVRQSLAQFTERVGALVDESTKAMKAADAPAVSSAMSEHWPAPGDHGGGQDVHARGTVSPDDPYAVVARKAASAAQPREGDDMDPKQLQAIALNAASTAMQVAKASNPAITPPELQAIGNAAMIDVFKAAVGGPAQPQIPTGQIDSEIMRLATNGMAPDPHAHLGSAITSLGTLVRKAKGADGADVQIELNKPEQVRELLGKTLDRLDKLEADNAELRDLAAKQAQLLGAHDAYLQRQRGAPARAPAGRREPVREPETVAKQREPLVGDGGDPWEGTALDHTDLVRKRQVTDTPAPAPAAPANPNDLTGIR